MTTEQALLALLAALVLAPMFAGTLACMFALARLRGKVSLDLHLDPEQSDSMTTESRSVTPLRNSVTHVTPNPEARVTVQLNGPGGLGPEVTVPQDKEVPESVKAAIGKLARPMQ